jgi:hypothetical protein
LSGQREDLLDVPVGVVVVPDRLLPGGVVGGEAVEGQVVGGAVDGIGLVVRVWLARDGLLITAIAAPSASGGWLRDRATVTPGAGHLAAPRGPERPRLSTTRIGMQRRFPTHHE